MTRKSAFILALAASVPTFAHASVVDATWLGSNSTWNNAAAWNIGVVPKNGANTYNATINAGTATVSFSPSITIDYLTVGPSGAIDGSSLTTTVGARIDGRVLVETGTLQIGSSGLLTGTGTVTVGGFGFAPALKTSAATLTIDTAMHVIIPQGAIGARTTGLINRGSIVGGRQPGNPNFADLSFNSLQNLGTIEARGGTLSLDGNFHASDLGSLVWGTGGAFGVAGTLLNDNTTFNVESRKPWQLIRGGTLSGGTLTTAPGSHLFVPYLSDGTINNVAVNGQVELDGSSTLRVAGGPLHGNGEILLHDGYAGETTRIESATSTPLEIQSGMQVRSVGGVSPGGASGTAVGASGALSINNHGHIQTDDDLGFVQLSISGQNVFNDGVLSIASNSLMRAGPEFVTPGITTFGTGGTLDIEMSAVANKGILSVAGTLDLTAAGDQLLLSAGPAINVGAFYQIATTGHGVVGTFDSVSPGFEVMYTSNEIFARYVPEPTMGGALLVSWAALRHRRKGVRERAHARRPPL